MARDYSKRRVVAKREFKRQSQQPSSSEPNVVVRKGLSVGWLLFFLVLVALATFFATKQMLQNDSDKSVVKLAVTKVEILDSAPLKTELELPKDNLVASKPPVESIIEDVVPIEPIANPKRPYLKIDYSFYNGLAETEVLVDVEPISIKLASAYYIQAGTFGKESQALIEQQRLARKGQKLDITTYTTKIRTYYRLRVGPFDNRLKMNKKRNELRRLGLDTLLVRARKL